MGLFSSKSKKIDKILEKHAQKLKNQAKAEGGSCRNCRYYDSYRGVCINGKGHVTNPNNLCEFWEI